MRSLGRNGSGWFGALGRSLAVGVASGGAFRAKVLHHAFVFRPFALVFLLNQGFFHAAVCAARGDDARIGAFFAPFASILAALARFVAVFVARFAIPAWACGKQRAEFLALDFPAILFHFFRAADQLAGSREAAAFAAALGAPVGRTATGRIASGNAARIRRDRLGREQGKRERQE